MRQLRFAGPAEDAGHFVLESVDGLDRFRLINDDALRTAVAAATAFPSSGQTQTPPQASTPAPQRDGAEIGPREIQVRVRAGESPQDLADSLGVPLERVMRFAGPVVDERLRIVDEARRARARRTGREGTENAAVVFGEAVDDRFSAHGISPIDVSWDSRRREDGDWIVEATWRGGDSTHSASWAFTRSSRFVNALDDTATDLLSDRPIRPITPPAPEPERASLAAAPPLARGVVAFPPMPDAHTGPLPRFEEVFDQESREDAPRKLPDFIPEEVALDYDAPPLPLGITDPTTRPSAVPTLTNINRTKRGQSDQDRAARAHVPSWDDILLGVRRKD